MAVTDVSESVPGRRRRIGALGTGARIFVGVVLLGSVLGGELRAGGLVIPSLVLGLVGFPSVVLASQWLRARRDPSRFQATGPLGMTLNMGIVAVLFFGPWYVRPVWFVSDAVLVFYGASMLLAALRGYGGCEVLAVSNWLLRRDDQVGCLVFAPVDLLERRLAH
jgi:hypothetical protein